MSEFENMGKLAWEILSSNRPTVNEQSDFVNAIPKGAEWADLSAPAGANHFDWEWRGPGLIISDFWFVMQIEWTYGARYHGGGAYLTNAVVRIIDRSIGLGGYNINISCRVGHIENVGTETAPVPRIPIDVSLGYSNWLYGGGGTNRFQVQGDGAGHAHYDSNSYEP
ncbi:MAG: hypothetical protein QOC94_400 [Actinoplanes sp.]|nr:hypothetical protein [Actinoplanes sp.]